MTTTGHKTLPPCPDCSGVLKVTEHGIECERHGVLEWTADQLWAMYDEYLGRRDS